MRIAVAQVRVAVGDVDGNVTNHVRLVARAVAHGAQVVAFPELSITGYEPGRARELATDQDDGRLLALERLGDASRVAIAVGVPTRTADKPTISLVVFAPQQPRAVCSKAGRDSKLPGTCSTVRTDAPSAEDSGMAVAPGRPAGRSVQFLVFGAIVAANQAFRAQLEKRPGPNK